MIARPYPQRPRVKSDPSLTADAELTRDQYTSGTVDPFDEPIAVVVAGPSDGTYTLTGSIAQTCAAQGTTTVVLDNTNHDSHRVVRQYVDQMREKKRHPYAPPAGNRHERRRQRAMTRRKT